MNVGWMERFAWWFLYFAAFFAPVILVVGPGVGLEIALGVTSLGIADTIAKIVELSFCSAVFAGFFVAMGRKKARARMPAWSGGLVWVPIGVGVVFSGPFPKLEPFLEQPFSGAQMICFSDFIAFIVLLLYWSSVVMYGALSFGPEAVLCRSPFASSELVPKSRAVRRRVFAKATADVVVVGCVSVLHLSPEVVTFRGGVVVLIGLVAFGVSYWNARVVGVVDEMIAKFASEITSSLIIGIYYFVFGWCVLEALGVLEPISAYTLWLVLLLGFYYAQIMVVRRLDWSLEPEGDPPLHEQSTT